MAALAVTALTATALPAVADHGSEQWIAAWGAPINVRGGSFTPPADSTVRNIARISLGGSAVRIRLSNELSEDVPLVVGAATVALRDGAIGAELVEGTTRAVRFGGQAGVTVAPGTDFVYSDPVEFPVEALAHLAVTLYLPEAQNPNAGTADYNTSYATGGGAGDHTETTSGESFGTQSRSTYALTAIDVLTDEADGAVVGLGSSSLHGSASTPDSYNRVIDSLAERINDNVAHGERKGIVGAGIGGDTLQASINGRFERDVLSQTGVTGVIIYNINDIAFGRTAEEIIVDYRRVIRRSHRQGVLAFCPTWGPQSHGTAGRAEKDQLNTWIRESGECDAIVDWDAVLRDPTVEDAYRPEYFADSIHPNDAGHRAMAAATPVGWFTMSPAEIAPRDGCPRAVQRAEYSDLSNIAGVHRRGVDCATLRGIVRGYTDGSFRPRAAVNRGQMATYVAQVLDAADGARELPAASQSEDTFRDVKGSAHERNIRRLSAAGIVSGVTQSRYAPADTVRRDQMASFLLRATEYAAGMEIGALASERQVFNDVADGSAHFATVNGAAEQAITAGVSALQYAPATTVRREAMATFTSYLLGVIESGPLDISPE